jgi:hypothetical protein
MTHHQAYMLSLSGTVTIWLGGVWMLVGGIGYLSRVARHRSTPTSRGMARAKRQLERLLGEPDLPGPGAQAASAS